MKIESEKVTMIKILMTQEEAHELAREMNITLLPGRPLKKRACTVRMNQLFELLDERML